MLEKIYLDGFRHFRNCVLELNPILLLCGHNGSGKTSVVYIMAKLRDFISGRNKAAGLAASVDSLCASEDIPRWEKKDYGGYLSTLGFEYRLAEAGLFKYEVHIAHSFHDGANRVEEESLRLDGRTLFHSQAGNLEVRTDGGENKVFPVDWAFSGLNMAARFNRRAWEFQAAVGSRINAVSLNPHETMGFHESRSDTLAFSGSNFSAWYDYLRDQYPKESVAVFDDYQYFMPGFKQLSFHSLGEGRRLMADFLSPRKNYALSFDELSHGQKTLCVLYALIHCGPEGSVIMIDEFENYLAPSELQPFYNAAQQALEERGLQLILVSHHEKTLNWYHDTALLFSLSDDSPAMVKVEKHNPDEYPASLLRRLEEGE